MKRLIATAALLFVLLSASNADAGIMYGNRLANRLSTGTGGFTRFYRFLGRMEYRKDMWLFGRPLGDPPVEICPECGQPLSTHTHYQSPQPQPAAPQPAPAKPAAGNGAPPQPTVYAAPPVKQ